MSVAAPTGYVSVTTDSAGVQVYVDNTIVLAGPDETVVEMTPGKHFVSLFKPRKVYQAFKDESPEQFWEKLREQRAFAETDQLMSSYERGAVRVGTKWVYVAPDDTIPARLSTAKVQETYNRDSACVLGTFLGWTLLVGAAMLGSVFLISIE